MAELETTITSGAMETEVVATDATEVAEEQEFDNAESSVAEAQQESQKSVEDVLSELMAENRRLKKAVDKASSEAATYKKQAYSNKSEAEQKAIEKAEEDARIKEELAELRKESAMNKLEKNFIALGYSEEMAKQAAEAQYDNDTDTLFQLSKKFLAEKEKAIKSKLMKTMPTPSIGNDDTISVTKEQFSAMGYKERLDLRNNHPKVYEQLTK